MKTFSPSDPGGGWSLGKDRAVANLFRQQMPAPLKLWEFDFSAIPQPDAASYPGGLAFDTSSLLIYYSDGTNWLGVFGAGTDAAAARALLGLGAVSTQGYTTGTFTPALDLGGAAVGVTYGGRGGRYTTIGRMAFVELFIVLTSKGTSVGTATITGLPSAPGAQASVSVLPIGLAAVTAPLAGIQPAQTKVDLYDFSGATIVAMSNTNLTNTSQIYISASYSV